MGRGMEIGPKIQITAVITPVKVRYFTGIQGLFEDAFFMAVSFRGVFNLSCVSIKEKKIFVNQNIIVVNKNEQVIIV